MKTVQQMLARHAKACEFTQPHDPERAAHHLRDWIAKCGGPAVEVVEVRDWASAASAAGAAWAAGAARGAARGAAWAAWAAWAASAAIAAWDASYASLVCCGAPDAATLATWEPIFSALECGTPTGRQPDGDWLTANDLDT